jgi:hypothetical protein
MHIYIHTYIYIYVYVLPFWALVFLKYCAFWACTCTYTQICCIGCRVYNGEGPIVTWTHEGSTISESSWWCYQTILRFLMNQIDVRKETWPIFHLQYLSADLILFVNLSECFWTIIHKWACTLTHTNAYIYNYTCMYVCIYIYIYTKILHTYIRTYVHTYYVYIHFCV